MDNDKKEPIRLIAGESQDVTPLEWKSDPPPNPVRGTVSVKGGTVTVNVVSVPDDIAVGDTIVYDTRGLGPQWMPRGLAHEDD